MTYFTIRYAVYTIIYLIPSVQSKTNPNIIFSKRKKRRQKEKELQIRFFNLIFSKDFKVFFVGTENRILNCLTFHLFHCVPYIRLLFGFSILMQMDFFSFLPFFCSTVLKWYPMLKFTKTTKIIHLYNIKQKQFIFLLFLDCVCIV